MSHTPHTSHTHAHGLPAFSLWTCHLSAARTASEARSLSRNKEKHSVAIPCPLRWLPRIPPLHPNFLPRRIISQPACLSHSVCPRCLRCASNRNSGPMGRPWGGSGSRPDGGRNQVRLLLAGRDYWPACPHLCTAVCGAFSNAECVVLFRVWRSKLREGWWRNIGRWWRLVRVRKGTAKLGRADWSQSSLDELGSLSLGP
jgi:hypothetical protein